jgi:hypothetical protein
MELRHSSFVRLVLAAASVMFLGVGGLKTYAQEGTKPNRGFHPTGSYALTDLETINTTNGNLMLHVPMVSLPPGRGGHPGGGFTLNYNSKVWDTYVEVVKDQFGQPVEHNLLISSGWIFNTMPTRTGPTTPGRSTSPTAGASPSTRPAPRGSAFTTVTTITSRFVA